MGDRQALGRDLGAQQVDRSGRRPDEDQASVSAGPCEVGTLGKKPIARMDRLGTTRPGRCEDRLDAQIAFARLWWSDTIRSICRANMQRLAVGIAVDRDRR